MKNRMDERKYLSPEEVGKMFRASKWTVRRWVDAGRLPALRLGRRLLIPAFAVEKLVEEQLSPRDLQDPHYVTLEGFQGNIVRGPAPRPDYIQNPFSPAELTKLADVVIKALMAGGWPYGIFELPNEGVQQIIIGKETAPPMIWRYLCRGIERLLPVVPVEQSAKEIKRSKK